jgi:hypothetical protein
MPTQDLRNKKVIASLSQSIPVPLQDASFSLRGSSGAMVIDSVKTPPDCDREAEAGPDRAGPPPMQRPSSKCREVFHGHRNVSNYAGRHVEQANTQRIAEPKSQSPLTLP